ncbi:hypothetical protein DFJ74DRAFT_696428 [Hyaloraphidium curvatum]|nr:hypothetical protein DFJ74DRAFT_696428 [Hyaloraphidium curvatum]
MLLARGAGSAGGWGATRADPPSTAYVCWLTRTMHFRAGSWHSQSAKPALRQSLETLEQSPNPPANRLDASPRRTSRLGCSSALCPAGRLRCRPGTGRGLSAELLRVFLRRVLRVRLRRRAGRPRRLRCQHRQGEPLPPLRRPAALLHELRRRQRLLPLRREQHGAARGRHYRRKLPRGVRGQIRLHALHLPQHARRRGDAVLHRDRVPHVRERQPRVFVLRCAGVRVPDPSLLIR